MTCLTLKKINLKRIYQKQKWNIAKLKKRKKKYMEKDEKPIQRNELTYKGVTIKDSDEKKKKRKYIKKFLTKEGQFLFEIGDDKKCHCCSNKKYRNCCKVDDISGDFDKDTDEFFCDVERFLLFYTNLPQENQKRNGHSSEKESEKDEKEKTNDTTTTVQTIEKKMATIYI